MSNIISFLSGTIFGAYLAQNYEIVNIKRATEKIIKYLDSIEKKNDE